MAAVAVIVVLIGVFAGLALGLHLILRRYLLAVAVTGVVTVGLELLIVLPGPRPPWSAIGGMAVLTAIAMAISALAGWPAAIARKRKADEVRGFEVLPPDRH